MYVYRIVNNIVRPGSSVGSSNSLVMNRSGVRISSGAPNFSLWTHRLTVRTLPFHGKNRDSNSLGFTNYVRFV